jgi:hypothetical protein
MSALSDHLERLLHSIEGLGLQPPAQDVRIIEVNDSHLNRDDGTYHVRRDAFRKPFDYEARFNELLQLGYGWLNLSCYGVYEGFLIVAVEVPSATVSRMTPSGWSPEGEPRSLRPGYHTSVNVSGPASTVLDQQWRIDSVLTVT